MIRVIDNSRAAEARHVRRTVAVQQAGETVTRRAMIKNSGSELTTASACGGV
jgi:hypothetical protein